MLDSLQSVVAQDYGNYELIVVDDGSADGSVSKINEFLKAHPAVRFIRLEKNVGICKAFNAAFKQSSGDFIIDLSADDVLLPNRLSRGISSFKDLGLDYGVIFSDAEWIDEEGQHLQYHSTRFPHHLVPSGDIYLELVQRFFICSPTMMFRRSVVDHLQGYDESLTYEDFDFWIRSSRDFKYFYDPIVLVKKRKVRNSLSHEQFKILNKHTESTYRVCEKMLNLNKSTEEQLALRKRIEYEIRQCIRMLDARLAYKYALLWVKNNAQNYNR